MTGPPWARCSPTPKVATWRRPIRPTTDRDDPNCRARCTCCAGTSCAPRWPSAHRTRTWAASTWRARAGCQPQASPPTGCTSTSIRWVPSGRNRRRRTRSCSGQPGKAPPTCSVASAVADLDGLRYDDSVWDAFVESAANGEYLQLSAWAKVKAPNGWRSVRVAADGGSGAIGAQVLLHRLGPVPASLGYATCGPAATNFDKASIDAFTAELRATAKRERLSHITIDPTISNPDVALRLAEAGWKRTKTVQVDRTWVVDLDQPEEALWQGLRSKWRQYVQKARKNGLTIDEVGVEGIDDLFRIVVDTANRAGFVYRSKETYRRVYESFAPSGRARMLLARKPDGEAVAALMLVHCGPKGVEPYGGMTGPGAQSRANYLLKWEAIRSSAERGLRVYDMWGMATPGIAQFKQGFGGREIRYIGAYDLVTSAPLRTGFGLYHGTRVRLGRMRRGDGGRLAAGGVDD